MGNAPGRFPVKAPEWSMWFDTYAPPTPWSLSRQPRRIRAGWKKLLALAAVTAVTIGAGWGLLIHRLAAERAITLALGLVTGAQLIRGFLWWDRFEHDRTVIRPLARRLTGVLDQAVGDRRSWLTVPWDYGINDDAKITIDVPLDFTGAERDMEDITRAVTVSTGWLSPQVETVLKSRHPRLVCTRSAPPPALVTSADVMPDILAAPRFTLVLGKGQKVAGKYPTITTSVKTDTPHTGFGMASQDGKSTAAMNAGCQMAHQGALLMILDYKMMSHMWADGLPNVCYAETPERIHEALIWLGWDERDGDGNIIRESELTRRKKVARAGADIHGNVQADVGPPLFIIAEELNATQRQLRNYWRAIGGRGPSPASWVLDEVAFTGAAILVFALYIAQRLGARASGSDGSRDAMENIGCFVLKDPPEQTWKLVAAGHAQPPKSGHKGRYQVVTRSEVREMQGVLWTPEDARAFAMSGVIAVPRHDMPFVGRDALIPAGLTQGETARQGGPEQAFDITQQPPVLTSGEGPARAVKLAEAVAAGLFVSIYAARKVAQRQGWEPVGGDRYTGFTYSVQDIYAYLRAKESR